MYIHTYIYIYIHVLYNKFKTIVLFINILLFKYVYKINQIYRLYNNSKQVYCASRETEVFLATDDESALSQHQIKDPKLCMASNQRHGNQHGTMFGRRFLDLDPTQTHLQRRFFHMF